MTTSRIVRGTKARIFLYICAVLIITGVIACYNNTLSQLDDARKSNEICHQQEENLSTQLQDYKQRLEKTLKTEKAEHQQLKSDLENRLNEEKSKAEKALNEATLKFNSLQQHFNLLQTQNEDLQARMKELQDELKAFKESKESLKSKYLTLQSENEHLSSVNRDLQKDLGVHKGDCQNQVNQLTKENHDLSKELNDLKAKCNAFEAIQPPRVVSEASSEKAQQQQVPSKQLQTPPNQNYIKTPLKSTASSVRASQGSLNGARPLLIPTVTPKNVPSALKKLPEGVVPLPLKTDDERNELPDDTVNNRYRNKISDISLKQDTKNKADEADKENGANEVFDPHNYDNFAFNDLNDPMKNLEKQNFNKQHIDHLGIDPNEENQQNLEENEPEDDDPDYADHLGRIKDPVVRN